MNLEVALLNEKKLCCISSTRLKLAGLKLLSVEDQTEVITSVDVHKHSSLSRYVK